MGSGGQWAEGHRAPALRSLPSSLVPAPGVRLESLRPLWAPESRATWPFPLAPIWVPRASKSPPCVRSGGWAPSRARGRTGVAPFWGHPGDGGRAGFHLKTPDRGGHLAYRPLPPAAEPGAPRPQRARLRCPGSRAPTPVGGSPQHLLLAVPLPFLQLAQVVLLLHRLPRHHLLVQALRQVSLWGGRQPWA